MNARVCPACGADPRSGAAACWLCRHPMPEPAAPPAAVPNFPVPPPLYRAEEDRSELDATSLAIGVGLVAAAWGAMGASGGVRNSLVGVALFPLVYVLLALVTDRAPASDSEQAPGVVRQVLRGFAITAAIVILVPIAVVIALLGTCAVVVFGAGALAG